MGMLPGSDTGELHDSCAIYSRVSTKKQADENTSIAVQLEMGRKYAAEHGWTIHQEYVDPGASGRSDKGRPQFNAMIAEALTANPPFTVILVYDHSRFYRNAGQSEVTRAALRLNGVEVRSITQPIQDDGLMGSFAILMQAGVDQSHSATTAMKVRAGMAASAREGFYVGGNVPFGYRLDPVMKRGTRVKNKLAIKPEEACTVEYMFDLYLKGEGIKAITTRLNAEGRMNRRGKRWYKSAVGNLLSSPTYAGRHQFRPTNWRTKRLLSESEWIVIPCPAIVDEAKFQKVQSLLVQRRPGNTAPRETTSDVLLAKIARCGSCGGPLQAGNGTGRNKTIYNYYKCAAKMNTGSCPGGCPTSIPRDDLDNFVLGKMADELFTPMRVQEIAARAAEMQTEARGTASTHVRQLKRQLAAAKLRESHLWDLAEDQGLTARAGFRGRLDAVQQEVAELGRLVSVQEQVIERSIRPLSQSEADQSARKMRSLLLEANIKQKRRFVRSIIEKVIVKKEVIEIIGPELTVAEVANDEEEGFRPPVRSSAREWLTRMESGPVCVRPGLRLAFKPTGSSWTHLDAMAV